MSKIIKNTGKIIGASVLLWPGLCLFILIVTIGLVKDCVGPKIDPMDNSINKMRERIRLVSIYDSTLSGFELQYYTKVPVTTARFNEILTRKHIFESIDKLEHDAPIHFKHNLIKTDIYDFAEFAKRYDVDPDICIAAIFVLGYREELYLQPNPKLVDGCTWYDPGTQQGILYIKQDDIYPYNADAKRTYRYWECPGNYPTSSTDEQYTHFRECERIRR